MTKLHPPGQGQHTRVCWQASFTKNDLRQAEINRQPLIDDRELLVRATQAPTSFIVAPGAVLNYQPGLKRLREGLVDAQLSGSQLIGKFTDNHPSVIASQSAPSSIVKRFLKELRASIAGVESELCLSLRRSMQAQYMAVALMIARLVDEKRIWFVHLSRHRTIVLQVWLVR